LRFVRVWVYGADGGDDEHPAAAHKEMTGCVSIYLSIHLEDHPPQPTAQVVEHRMFVTAHLLL